MLLAICRRIIRAKNHGGRRELREINGNERLPSGGGRIASGLEHAVLRLAVRRLERFSSSLRLPQSLISLTSPFGDPVAQIEAATGAESKDEYD
jgi:hypothetical protein